MTARRWVGIAAVLAAVSCAAAVYYGVTWLRAPDGTTPATGDREVVLEEARSAAAALTSLDADSPDESVARWKDVTTGPLKKAVGRGAADFQELISVGKVNSQASVQDAAVASLDEESGSASVLVGLDIRLEPAQGKAEVKRLRLVVTMAETEDGWKARELRTVGG